MQPTILSIELFAAVCGVTYLFAIVMMVRTGQL
jgi:hypothetical protein